MADDTSSSKEPPNETRSGTTKCQREGCNNVIDRPRWNKRFCSRECQAHSARGTRPTRFVGIDGEGVDRPDGLHEYVMLSVGSRTLFDAGNQLTLDQILTFLYDQFTLDTQAVYVGFFLGYDFTQWFKHLDQQTAWHLFTTAGTEARKTRNPTSNQRVPQPVVWNGWEIDVLAGRRVKLRPHHHRPSLSTGKCKLRTCGTDVDVSDPFLGEHPFNPETDPLGPGILWRGSGKRFWEQFRPKQTAGKWMHICDTGPFWQCSFLNAIDPTKWTEPVCTEQEFNTIIEGKADRGHVYDYNDTSYFDDMRRYNVLENDVLSRITTRLDTGFRNEHIPIKLARTDWYGPGRAAQRWMDLLHARVADPEAVRSNRETVSDRSLPLRNELGIKNADVYLSMPTWFADAARASYYGGWFEIFMHGHIGDAWEYDINSAYPFIIATLPCLHRTGRHNGTYRQGEGDTAPGSPSAYVLLYGTVRGSDRHIGAMPHRTRRGSILRPRITRGWYWRHELDAASRAGIVESMDIEKWVSYEPCTCTPPFNPKDIGIERMYQMRLEVGKNSPQGKGFKLVYNSAYGKTAQSIGQPKYSNPVYASLTTAGCRTLILDAIASHPEKSSAVAMVATDGVYFTSPHPSLTLDQDRLGAWDETAKTGMTLFMPGVYWDDSTREKIRAGNTPSLKSRGINAKDLADQIERLDILFAQLHTDMVATPTAEITWPSIKFKVRFLLESCKSALNRNDWGSAGRVTHGATRIMSSSPESKRIQHPYLDPTNLCIRTSPYDTGPDGTDTMPYPKMFGQQSEVDEPFAGHIGRDGDDGMQYWRDLMKGM